jgi:hypothetical protein
MAAASTHSNRSTCEKQATGEHQEPQPNNYDAKYFTHCLFSFGEIFT